VASIIRGRTQLSYILICNPQPIHVPLAMGKEKRMGGAVKRTPLEDATERLRAASKSRYHLRFRSCLRCSLAFSGMNPSFFGHDHELVWSSHKRERRAYAGRTRPRLRPCLSLIRKALYAQNRAHFPGLCMNFSLKVDLQPLCRAPLIVI
jgi:hypothetical protein